MNLLETDTIRLRALEPQDVDTLYKWENDTSIWKVSNTVAPFSKYTLNKFIQEQCYGIFESKQMRLIIECVETKRPIGAIDLFDIDPINLRAGVGVLIYDDKDKEQGYASTALGILIRYCFLVLGLNQLYCNITANNKRSLTLFKSKGFIIIGLKQEWVKTTSGWQDEYLLQLINVQKN